MWVILRHLFAILALPFSVTVLVPVLLARQAEIALTAPPTLLARAAVVLGIVALAIGAALFSASVALFASRGRGTLAPWDPPVRFVVEGPYRYVRNPMIAGVVFLLAG